MDEFELHHVLHSLAIAKFISFPKNSSVLDFGTGGGFPGIPLAIVFPETKFLLVDSRGKKLKVVEAVIEELGLKNVKTLHTRVEDLNEQFDFISCRAVADLKNIFQWTSHLINKKNKGGWLLLKGGNLTDELKQRNKIFQQIPISNYFEEEYFKEKYLLWFE